MPFPEEEKLRFNKEFRNRIMKMLLLILSPFVLVLLIFVDNRYKTYRKAFIDLETISDFFGVPLTVWLAAVQITICKA